MPAYQKSKNHGVLFAIGGVFLSLKMKLSTKKSFFYFYILFYFLGVAYALISASFRAYKPTKIVQ